MKNIEVIRYQQRLDDLFKKIVAFAEDIELQSHWARYLCILVSGFLETLDGHFIKTLPVLVPHVIPAKAGIQGTSVLGTGCPPARA